VHRATVPGLPGLEDRVQDLPGARHLVVAGEEAGVTDHGVQQQGLVGIG